MSADFEPFFSTLGRENLVACSADASLCPHRILASPPEAILEVHHCGHIKAPLPNDIIRRTNRICVTPELDELDYANIADL